MSQRKDNLNMDNSPSNTPAYHNVNFHHQNRGGRGGYGQHQPRNNSNNDHFHRFSKSHNSSNTLLEDMVMPLDSSSPVFYRKRGNRRQLFNRHNQSFPSTGVSRINDNQRNFHNNSDSLYQRNPKQLRQKNELNWHRRLPINVDNPSINITIASDEQGDTLSNNNSEENSTDVNNSRNEQNEESSIDLQLEEISFSNNSKTASI
ncbi:homeobox protein 2-like isoform X3 [Phymastichus coffea]|uniref:homeobox protein 2-like isoform X3 n=1 Tax=Phymastichus coffea TaxID=108790 RepID=UPI00273C676B|nr:homeobox protein 2-like isoform X3 [Phymastichus coffea]